MNGLKQHSATRAEWLPKRISASLRVLVAKRLRKGIFKMKISTKKALIASVLSLVLCVSMLVGSTFAWFTDTATTSVNTIQAGTLKVDIVNESGTSLKGSSMSFVNSDGSADILWEPGATFRTIGFKVKNIGNLAFKYKMVLNGVDGDNELLNVITFKVVKADGTAVDLSMFEGHLTKDAESEVLYIEGHMAEDAGNDYQGKELTGLGITVYATQDTVEKDSKDDQYDKDATYSVANVADLAAALGKDGIVNVVEDLNPAETVVSTANTTLNMGGKTVANTSDLWNDDTDSWSLVSARVGELTIEGNGKFAAKENDCFAVDVQDGAKVVIKDGTFIGNIHAVYVYEGELVVEGGFYSVQQKYSDAAKANEFVLNCYDANRAAGTAKITVKGGTYVNFNPADCYAEGEHTNFVADGYKVTSAAQENGDVWYTVSPINTVSASTAPVLKSALVTGGVVTVVTEIKTDNIEDTEDARVIIKESTTLNLNAKIVTPDDMGNNNKNFCALIVDADTTINASENGGIDTGTNGGYGINVRNGATLTINGGNYYGGGTAVQVQKGTLIINGGTFACEPFGEPYGTNFLLNCVDSAYKNGTAKIIVKGGTFVNFDPSNNAAEGAGTNFVADGYKVISEVHGEDTWYIVVPE